MTNSLPSDPIVLAVIQDQTLLHEEYSKTQKKLKSLHQKLIHDDLDEQGLENIKKEIKQVKDQFKAFAQMITEHAQWLEQQSI